MPFDATFLAQAAPYAAGASPDQMALDQVNHLLWLWTFPDAPGDLCLVALDTRTNEVAHALTIDPDWGSFCLAIGPDETLYLDDQSGASGVVRQISVDDGSLLATSPSLAGDITYLMADANAVYVLNEVDPGNHLYLTTLSLDLSTILWETDVVIDAGGDHQLALDGAGEAWIGNDQSLWHIDSAGVPTEYDLTAELATNGHINGVGYDAASNSLLVLYARPHGSVAPDPPNYTYKFSLASLTIVATISDPSLADGSHQSVLRYGSQQGAFWLREAYTDDTGSNTSTFHQLDMPSFTIARSYTLVDDWEVTDEEGSVDAIRGHVHDICTPALWVWRDGDTPVGVWQLTLPDEPDPSCVIPMVCDPVPLKDIVADLCRRAGLAPEQYDVSALEPTVHGYTLTRRMPARQALEPLQQAYFFDAIESDNILKFTPRGGSVAATITADDLAAHADAGDPPDPLTHTRAQEVDLPRQIDLLYIDPAQDYQQGTQSQQRHQSAMASRDPITVSIPVALSASEARQIAEKTLFLAWVDRDRYSLTLPPKYARLDPADIAELTYDSTLYRLRLTSIDLGADGVLRCDAQAEQPAVYLSTIPGAPALGVPLQTIVVASPTVLYLLDIPLLRDVDDDAGFYSAMSTTGLVWPGAILYTSADEALWETLITESDPSTAGVAASVLAAGPTDTFDRANTLTVSLSYGTLTSYTPAQVLNQANAALVGNEILQWTTATEISADIWTLSGLLRGRRGTEWAIGTHSLGERFLVLSSATTRRITRDAGLLDLPRFYRAVTSGSSLSTTDSETFTNTGIGKTPYSPVRPRGSRDGSSNLTISWIRRTRLGGEWQDSVDASLGEATESYEVEIYDTPGGTVLRTITGLSTQTATYSAANQTTDFGSPQSSITVRIYQLSAVVGRGYGAEATI